MGTYLGVGACPGHYVYGIHVIYAHIVYRHALTSEHIFIKILIVGFRATSLHLSTPSNSRFISLSSLSPFPPPAMTAASPSPLTLIHTALHPITTAIIIMTINGGAG